MGFEIASAFIKIMPQLDKGAIKDAAEEMGKTTMDHLDKWQGGLQQAGGTLTKWVTGPILGVTAALGGLVLASANSADELIKNARRADITTTSYQELEYALGQAGLAQADLGGILDKNNNRIGMALSGNEKFAEAFESVGAALVDVNGNARTSGEIFDDVLKGLAAIEDPALRAAKASELYGAGAGPKLAAALDGGIEAIDAARRSAHDLGIIMSEDALEGVEEFNDTLDNMKRAFGGLVQGIGLELMPIISELIPVLQEKLVPALAKVGENIGKAIKWFQELGPTQQKIIVGIIAFAAAIGPVLIVAAKLIGVIKGIIVVGKVLTGVVLGISWPVLAVVAAIAALIAIGVLLWKNWDTIKEKAIEIFNRIRTVVTDAFNRVRTAVTNAFNAVIDFMRSIPSRITSALGNLGSLLFDAGKSILRGLVDGIKSMAMAPVNAVKDVVSNVRRLLPFSPAKEGPFSGKGYTTHSGRALVKDFAKGILDSEDEVAHALEKLGLNATGVLAGSNNGLKLGVAGAGASVNTGDIIINIESMTDLNDPEDRRRIAEALRQEIRRMERETV